MENQETSQDINNAEGNKQQKIEEQNSEQKLSDMFNQQLQKTLNEDILQESEDKYMNQATQEKINTNSKLANQQNKLEVGGGSVGGVSGLNLAQKLAQFQQFKNQQENITQISQFPLQQQQNQQQQISLQQQPQQQQQQQAISPDNSSQNIQFPNRNQSGGNGGAGNYDDYNDQFGKNKRRTKNDPNNRDFLCGCGKSYLSYPAFYTHIKQKHNGQQPPGTILPQSNKGVRGRPKKDEKQDQKVDQLDDRSDYSDDMFEPLDDLFYYISEISKKINPNNEYSYIQDISLDSIDCKKCFPMNLFKKEEDYASLVEQLDQIQQSRGQMQEFIDQSRGVKNVSCNYIFAKFLFSISKHLKEPCYQEIAFLIAVYRLILNQNGWKIRQEEYEEELPANQEEFCEQNFSEVIPDICNDFISDHFPRYLEQNKEQIAQFKIIGQSDEQQKNAICIIQYFCNWMYANKYTNSKLSMNNDDEDFLNYDPLYNDMENDDEDNEDSQDSEKDDDANRSISDL